MLCWICNSDAQTGEHIPKKSDLHPIFGHVSQQKQIYMHFDTGITIPVKGMNANVLKSGAKICAKCNNQITQPYDQAWERLSQYLRNMDTPIQPNKRIRLKRVFPSSIHQSMLNVHLYFVKLFGCRISEHEVPLDIRTFSQAILNNRAHPNIYIAICPPIHGGTALAGCSEITAEKRGGRIIFAVWFYLLDNFSVRVVYSDTEQKRQGLRNSWHPSNVEKFIRISTLY